MTRMAARVADFGTTIFTEMNELAARYQAVNLGQGAPDFASPALVVQAAQRAVTTSRYQYAPGWGYPEMRQAVAQHAERFYGQAVDPTSEVVITNGATEAIFATMMGLLNPGDEIIFFEPFYDSYVASVKMAGAIPRFIPLHAPTWEFDWDELKGMFNPRTRAIMVNTPHNPTGKVYTRPELEYIAELCQAYDVIAITDEVYEHILYTGAQHLRLATLPGMAKRTLTLSSIGKTFTATGWKIGWAIGAPDLVRGVFQARQFISFAVASLLQSAAADVLSNAPMSYYEELQQLYQAKRDFLYTALQQTKLKPIMPQGSYFIMADCSALGLPDDRTAADYLAREVGVVSIPPSPFYCAEHRHLAHSLLRFSVCKTDETLQAAAERLTQLA
jgi:N-succinyldiaminopimelate aminotransferase